MLHKLLVPAGYHLTGALLSTNKDVCASLVKQCRCMRAGRLKLSGNYPGCILNTRVNNANTELHVWTTHIYYYAQQSNFACMYKLLNIREHTYYTTVVIYVGN